MRYVLVMGFLILSTSLASAQVVCVTGQSAAVRMSPSEGSSVVLEAPTHYPLAVAAERDRFYEVADYRGRRGWVRQGDVGGGRCAVVTRAGVNVRGGPGTGHEVVLRAQEGVAFQVLRSVGDWAEVRHESGRSGFVYKALLWGVE
ncbi:MAG: SH3 domain-containing protein [Deferrisomatales bacterium]|nr:SH3 domain-containing protein [Deferrisomatales bacterium]